MPDGRPLGGYLQTFIDELAVNFNEFYTAIKFCHSHLSCRLEEYNIILRSSNLKIIFFFSFHFCCFARFKHAYIYIYVFTYIS